jgi:hypothetical protein
LKPAGVPAPRSAGQLQRLVRQYVREHGLAEKRVRDWISYMTIGGALEGDIGDRDAHPQFTVRGGVALELRRPGLGRATKDLDLTYGGPDADPVGALDDAIRAGYGRFTFRRTGRPLEMEQVQTVRVEVGVRFDGAEWGTITVDIGRAEGHLLEVDLVPAFDLRGAFGVDGPSHLACLSARYHLAHKLHAVTRPADEDRPNERVQDAIDSLLLRDLVPDLAAARQACVEVFAVRATHPWPPVFAPPAAWVERYAVLAGELGMNPDLAAATSELQALIDAINRTTPAP